MNNKINCLVQKFQNSGKINLGDELIEPTNKNDYFLDENGNILDEKVKDVVFSHVPKRKSKKQ